MAILPQDPPTPNHREKVGEIIPLPTEWQNEMCIQQYEKILNDFKELLTVINGGEPKPERFEYPPEIVLSRHDDGRVASRAIFNSDSCQGGTVNFNNADGFRIYLDRFSVDGVEEAAEYLSFSLLGKNEHNEILSPNKWQRPKLRMTTQAWLEEKLPLSASLLQEFWDAASNPDLNPAIAPRVASMIAKPPTALSK